MKNLVQRAYALEDLLVVIAGIALLATISFHGSFGRARTGGASEPEASASSEPIVEPEETVEMTGTFIDLACYMENGHNDVECARACVGKKQQPAGFLAEVDGAPVLHVVISGVKDSPSALVAPHWGRKAKITARVARREGLRAVFVESIEPAD